ncbi:Metallo-dependent phosphatase-like protein, partial [Ampelomyces quisqualis]
PHSPTIRLVCISDTHTRRPRLLPGDMLIHAGDLTINGTPAQLEAQIHLLNSLDYAVKIVTAGNHDVCLDAAWCARNPRANMSAINPDWGEIIYLQNSTATIELYGRRLNAHGAPYTTRYGNWGFQYPPQEDIWHNSVPFDTDILITHGPARGHVDADAGCAHLLGEVRRVRPKVHACGHVHGARGVQVCDWGWVHGDYDGAKMGEGGI